MGCGMMVSCCRWRVFIGISGDEGMQVGVVVVDE